MDDLISRSELERAIREYADRKHANGEDISYVNGILKSISIVKAAPSIDAKPVRHEYWVAEERVEHPTPNVTHKYKAYYCSECGRRLIGYTNPKDAPYCHCGAKMDSSEQGDNYAAQYADNPVLAQA